MSEWVGFKNWSNFSEWVSEWLGLRFDVTSEIEWMNEQIKTKQTVQYERKADVNVGLNVSLNHSLILSLRRSLNSHCLDQKSWRAHYQNRPHISLFHISCSVKLFSSLKSHFWGWKFEFFKPRNWRYCHIVQTGVSLNPYIKFFGPLFDIVITFWKNWFFWFHIIKNFQNCFRNVNKTLKNRKKNWSKNSNFLNPLYMFQNDVQSVLKCILGPKVSIASI